MMKILKRSRIGEIDSGSTMTARTFSTCVCVAASISRTSTSRPSAISVHASQVPHGSAVGPFTQLSARARMRAVVVFPTPRGPAKMKDCASLPLLMAFFRVSMVPRWPMTSSNFCGRHFRANARWDICSTYNQQPVTAIEFSTFPTAARISCGTVQDQLSAAAFRP